MDVVILLGFLLFLMYSEGCFLCLLLHWAVCSILVKLIAVAEIFPLRFSTICLYVVWGKGLNFGLTFSSSCDRWPICLCVTLEESCLKNSYSSLKSDYFLKSELRIFCSFTKLELLKIQVHITHGFLCLQIINTTKTLAAKLWLIFILVISFSLPIKLRSSKDFTVSNSVFLCFLIFINPDLAVKFSEQSVSVKILCDNRFGVMAWGNVLNIFSWVHGHAVLFCVLMVNIPSPCALDAGSLIHKCPRWFASESSGTCKQVMPFSV